LQFVGIPQTIIVNVCQDSNKNGICGVDELQTKVTINKGDSVDDIWRKIALNSEGQYFLETYNPELPLLIEIEDASKVDYDSGKFTLAFDGFKTKEQNETKEISILESMVDADAINKVEADSFRTLINAEAQEKFYTTLLDNLETNINTLRRDGLDSKTAVTATIKEMGDEIKANQESADKINNCGNNQTCVDKEIKKVSDELIIDKNEAKEIATNNGGATPESTTTPEESSTAPTSKSTLKKTGQTTSYEQFDDGHYQIGVTPSYSRSGEIVTDNVTGLQWQDNEEAKTVKKNWEDAKSYCLALSLGGQSDWRLPTRKELKTIIDYGKTDPAIYSVFQNFISNYYWSSTTRASDSSHAWDVGFDDGLDYRADKVHEGCVRCVRGGQ